jgi:putative PIN family toxin of toxin-antitoxin system
MPKNISRIFLDSNVILSGLYSPRNAPGKILEYFIEGRIRVVISQQILEEIVRAVKNKLPGVLPLLNTLLVNSPPEIVADPETAEIRRWTGLIHPEDAAISAEPDYFITGDNDFLENPTISTESGLKIITPAQFLKLLG